MSDDFWLNALARATHRNPPLQASRQTQTPTPQHHRAWWDTTPQQAPEPTPPAPPATEYRPQQAKSAEYSSRCPNCGSENYAPIAHHPEPTFRCFDCSPMQQTGAVQAAGKSIQATRQVSTENNFHPGHIIGRV